VVEDNEVNLDVAVALLTEIGIKVDTAPNGHIAVDKVNRSPIGYYDAILMDIQMPVMDGCQATRQIRKNELLGCTAQSSMISSAPEQNDSQPLPANQSQPLHVPIIALTAHALKGEKEKCLTTGMDDYIAKPIDVEQLDKLLLKWIVPMPGEQSLPQGPCIDWQPVSADISTVLDVPGALKRLAGKRHIYVTALKDFAPECGQADQIIGQSLAEGDRQSATRKAHTVKGVAATIGAVDLSQVAAKLQKAIEQNVVQIDEQMNLFQSELKRAMKAVDAFLSREGGQ
jgi:CheY-like chemotaxis protein